jgi:hypothetical protein
MQTDTPTDAPATISALRRHFEDLRDGTHGSLSSRRDKEALFAVAVELLAPYAEQVLEEINVHLLLGEGRVTATGLVVDRRAGPSATWALVWGRQQDAGIPPVTLHAFYGSGFHHPHLRGATNGEWPLNVYTSSDAVAEVPTMRAIAAGDLHNLVFRADYRIIPAVVTSPSRRAPRGEWSQPGTP